MKAKSARSKAARPQQLQDVLSLKKTLLFVAIASVLGSQAAMAGPEGGQIVNGVGSIVQTDPSSTLVTQGSDRLGIDWQSFNVAEHESVRFDQPSSSAIALNRIFDQNPSLILGALDANGHVFLINPNGMVFGEGAQINVAGLVASSLDLSQEDFAAGNFNFAGSDSSGIIVNRGLIQAATGGSVTLLGGGVANEGVIVAELGQVNLGAGTRASLDFTGDGLLFFEVDGALLANNTGADAAVSNSGTIQANGGSVLLTAAAARGVFSNVVNNSGLVSATRIENHGGVIRLVGDGGDVITSGTIDASGQGGAGGTVQVLGDRVGLTGSAVVDVSGDTGGGSAQIGGGFQGSDPNVKNADATFVGAGTKIDASAGAVGNGGEVVVWADGITRFNGEIDVRGGAVQGDGGFVEVSGKDTLLYRGKVDLGAASGTAGTLLLDPLSITIEGGADPASPALDDGTVNFDDDPDNAAYTIYEESLETLAAGTVLLEATQSITTSARATFDNTEATGDADGVADSTDDEGIGVVLLQGGVNLVMRTRNVGAAPAGDGAGNIDIRGGTGTALKFQTQGTGTITLAAGDDAATDQLSSLVVGDLQTADQSITLSAQQDVSVHNVNAGTGDVQITVGVDGVDGHTLTIEEEVAGNATGSRFQGGGASTGHTLLAGSKDDAIVIDTENTLNLIPFQDFGDVSGGGGVDTFTINVSHTGTLRGGAGNDKFSLGGNVAATVDGEAGSDELIASTAGTLFTLTNTNAGTAAQRVAPPLPETTQTVNFTSVENLTGNTGADRFVLGFDLGDPTELTPILGAAKGNDGDDEFALDASQTGTLKGGAGNDKFSLGGNVAATVDGEAGSDELIASTAGTLFTLTNTNAGTAAQRVAPPLPETTQTVNFTSVENLTGNTGADRFVLGFDLGDPTELTPILGAAKGNDGDDEFALDASQTGTLKGGAGNDKFSLGGNVAATVDGEAGSDELIASTAGTLFTLTNTNAGTAAQRVAPPLPETTQTVNFTSVENLTGNTGADRFVLDFDLGDTSESILGAALGNDGADEFAIKANQSGTIKGGNDGDKFTIDGDVTATVKGDAGSDELIATAATVFDLSSTNAGTAVLKAPGAGTVNFESVENLTGSAGADQFVLDFNLGDSTELTPILGRASGNDGADEFTIKANQGGTIEGGNDGDKFTIDGNVTATVKGDAGSDELIATAATVFDLSSTNAGTAVLKAPGAGTVNFESVENLTGSAGADQFVLDFNLGDSTELTPILGRASGNDGADEFTIKANQGGTIEGGNDGDKFTIDGNVTATVKGDAGSDELIATAATVFDLSSTNAGTAVLKAPGAGTVNFESVENLTGSAGADQFVLDFNLGDSTELTPILGRASGNDGADEFTIKANQGGTIEGGNDGDKFTIDGNVTATVKGDAGSDELIATAATVFDLSSTNAGTAVLKAPGAGTVNFESVENLTGSAGADQFVLDFNLGDASESILGAALGNDGADEFAIAGNQAGIFDGGEGSDTFTLAGNAVLSNAGAAVDGGDDAAGDDSDKLDVAANATALPISLANSVVKEGFSGSATTVFTGGGFAAIDNIAGSADTLQGRNVASTWTQDTYSDGTASLTFTGITTAAGGTAADTLLGGAGVDVFTVAAAGSVTLNTQGFTGIETLSGRGDADVFNLNADFGGAVNGDEVTDAAADKFFVNASQTGALDGGAGDDVFTLGGDVAAANLHGGLGIDRLEASAAGTGTAFVSAAAAGTARVIGSTLVANFDAIENLTGNVGNDTFAISGNQTGVFDGGEGGDAFTLAANAVLSNAGAAVDGGDDALGDDSDTLNVAANAAALTVSLTNSVTNEGFSGSAATVFTGGGFAAIDNVVGSADTLQGRNVASTWTQNTYSDGTEALTFSGITTAAGGTAADTLLGGAGVDVFTVAAAGGVTLNNLQNFTGIDTLHGLGGADQFNLNADFGGAVFGDGAADAFADKFFVNASQTGALDGGAGDDVFTLGGDVAAANLHGGLGIDRLEASAAGTGTAFVSAAAAGTARVIGSTLVANFDAIENLTGNVGNDTFAISGNQTGVFDGGEGGDAFTLAANAVLSNAGAAVDGGDDALGDDSDTLNVAANAAALTVSLTNSVTNEGFSGSAATVFTGGGFAAIDNVVGSADTLQGRNVASTWTQNTYSDGTEALTFSGIGTAAGGTAADTLLGGAGVDVFTVAAAGSVALNTQAFTGIETVSGQGDADVFNLNANFGGAINGDGGTDAFNVNATQAGVLDGGEESDTFTVAAAATLPGAGVRLTGGVDATGNDVDTLNVAANATALTISLTSSVTNEGFSGSATTVFTGGGSFAAIDDIVGSADTLQGRNVASTWTQNTYSDGAEALTFSGITTAAGGTAADTLLGGAGVDVFTVAAAGSVALNTQAFTGIETVSGQGDADVFNLNANFGGAINGDGGTDAFNVNATQAGVLDGGEESDTFTVAAAATLPGAGVRLTGGVDATGNDVDTLNVAANATALTISLTSSVTNEGFSGSAATVFTGGGFAAIDNVVGSADTLQGRNVASTWTQNTYSDGAEALTFSGITTAAGGTAADELRGNNLDDLFTVTAAGSVTLNTQGFTGIETLSGLGGADDFNLNANFGGAINGDAGTDEFFVNATQTGQLAGGDGDDDFRLGGNFGANIQGGNDGPSGDEIIASVSATTFTLSATGGTAQVIFAGTQTANFQGVENLTGNTGNDEFNLNFSLSGTASGGGGDDRFNLAAAVSAKVVGDAGADSLIGAPTTTKFNLAGNNAGSLTNGTGTVSFATLESLTGGAAADEFVLNTGTHNGNLVLVGGGGSDTADVRGSFAVTGNLTLNGIETITDNSGGTTLSAVTLTIAGATAVGESSKVLWTNVDNVDIQSSGPVFLKEKDGLTILHLDAASFYVTVVKNGLRLRLAEADGEGRFDVLGGDIVDINGDEVNMVASHALLSAPEGTVGTAQDKLDVRVPSGAFIDVQTKSRRASDAFIAASKGSHLRVAGREFIIGAGATTAEALLTNNTLLVDISGIDWASLDPTVTLLDCLEPCVRLPEDQAEDEELARLQAPTKLLLIRTSHGWKMIPVVVAAETAALRE